MAFPDNTDELSLSTFSRVFSSSSYNTASGKFNGQTIDEIVDDFLEDDFDYQYESVDFYKDRIRAQYREQVIAAINEYCEDDLTKVSSFFRLPNPVRLKNENKKIVYQKLTGIILFLNFFGWQENKTLGRQIINVISAPFYTVPKNLV